MNLRGGVLFIAVLLGVLVAAPSADAAVLFASPSGTGGPNDCLTESDPCSLAHALEDEVFEEDIVILATDAGPYTVSSPITVATDSVSFGSETAGHPAVINTGGSGALVADANAVGVFDVTINGTGSTVPLQFTRFSTGSGGSGVTVSNASTGPTGALQVEADIQLTDSLFVSATSGSTVLAGDGSFLNVTSEATANGDAFTGTEDIAGSARTFLLNSILSSAGGTDLVADGSHAFDYVYGSNFDNPGELNGGHVPFDDTNQTEAPALNPTFRQFFNSPTVDAGYFLDDYPTQDDLDLDGGPRCLNDAPDIGADEFDNGADCFGATGGDDTDQLPNLENFDFTAPVVSGFKATKKKGKIKAFTFTSTEPGFATLTYQRKKGKKYKSAGSQRKITVAGENSVKPKKLKKGSYKVTLRILDSSGNESSAKKLSFKVK